MADIDYDKLQTAMERAFRSRGGSGGGSGGGGAPIPTLDTSKLKEAVDKAGDGVGKFVEGAKDSTETFRGLSKAGSNFSNDIIGMNVAAAQSRLSLGEFADVVAQNGKNLAGLGGSVTRGSEAFAKASKGFFESDFTTRLQEMGFTAKDLNETLAVQLGTQRSTFRDNEEGRKRAYESANSLAREMDMIAKLTGKNREQQVEEAKKRSADGQVEAKLRLIGIEQGAEAEAKAREAFQKQFAEAEARGMGQMAKEMFATGTLTSNEAATQYALLGEAAQRTGEQMQHLSKGNVAAAEAASKQADAANAKNQRDPTLLRLATLGDAAGTAGTIMKKNVEDNMALHDSVMAVSKSMKPGLLTSTEDFGKALTKVRNDIESSRMGIDARGRQVSGATQGVIAGQRAAQEIRAGVAGAVEAENAQGESVGNAARRTGAAGREALNRLSGPGNTLAGNIERAAERGQQPETVTPRPGEGRYQLDKRKEEAAGGVIGLGTKAASELASATASALEQITMKVSIVGIPKYAEGGVVDTPQIALVGEAGPETIIPNKDIDKLVKQVISTVPVQSLPVPEGPLESTKDGMSDFAKGMTAFIQRSQQAQGIDISKISKEISTTVSSVTGGGETTTRRVQSDDSKKAEEELQESRKAYAEEREALRAKLREQMGPEASTRDVRKAMRESDDAKSIEAKYEEQQKAIQKRINDGITWEVEKKSQQVDNIKHVVQEELDIVQKGAADKLKITELSDEEIENSFKSMMAEVEQSIPTDMEFGDLEGAMENVTAPVKAPIEPIDLTKLNLPGFSNQMKSAQATIPAGVKQTESKTAEDLYKEKKEKWEKERASSAQPSSQQSPTQPSAPSVKSATLDDVVYKLEHLNKTMSQLLSQTEDLGNKQVRATRANNSNVLAR